MKKNKMIIDMSKAMLEEELPKSVEEGLRKLVQLLKEKEDNSITKDKCIVLLEELVDNNNLNPYVRSQLLDLVAATEQS